MEAVLEEPTTDPIRVAARATITGVQSATRVLTKTRYGEPRAATIALPYYRPRVGDGVLLLTDDEGGYHVVGVLPSLRAAAAPEPSSPKLELDPKTGATVLDVPGDLELRAARGTIRIAARQLEATTAETRLQSDRMELVARTLSTVAERSTAAFGILETRATRILEKARVAYRDVEDLAQTRAGRIRQIAERSWQAVGRRTLLRAEEDVKIRGEKIHLA